MMTTHSQIQEKQAKLDKRDLKLLDMLRADARMPVSDIAKKLGINRDTVKYRMTRLENAGIIKQYYAEVDRSVFGYFVCHVFMLLNETNRKRQDQLLREIKGHPNTQAVNEYNDKWDIKWTLVARHLEELDSILLQTSTKYSGVTLERDTLLLVRWSRADEANSTQVDEKDIIILKELCEDARRSAVEIGQKAGLSADAVIKRIRNLERTRVIRRYTIALDAGAMGKQWYTVVIQMKNFDEHNQEKLKEFVRQHPNIIRCYKTIGTWDVALSLYADDVGQFHTLFKELKLTFADIIRNYDTYVGYKENFISSLPAAVISNANKKS